MAENTMVQKVKQAALADMEESSPPLAGSSAAVPKAVEIKAAVRIKWKPFSRLPDPVNDDIVGKSLRNIEAEMNELESMKAFPSGSAQRRIEVDKASTKKPPEKQEVEVARIDVKQAIEDIYAGFNGGREAKSGWLGFGLRPSWSTDPEKAMAALQRVYCSGDSSVITDLEVGFAERFPSSSRSYSVGVGAAYMDASKGGLDKFLKDNCREEQYAHYRAMCPWDSTAYAISAFSYVEKKAGWFKGTVAPRDTDTIIRVINTLNETQWRSFERDFTRQRMISPHAYLKHCYADRPEDLGRIEVALKKFESAK